MVCCRARRHLHLGILVLRLRLAAGRAIHLLDAVQVLFLEGPPISPDRRTRRPAATPRPSYAVRTSPVHAVGSQRPGPCRRSTPSRRLPLSPSLALSSTAISCLGDARREGGRAWVCSAHRRRRGGCTHVHVIGAPRNRYPCRAVADWAAAVLALPSFEYTPRVPSVCSSAKTGGRGRCSGAQRAVSPNPAHAPLWSEVLRPSLLPSKMRSCEAGRTAPGK